MSVERSSYNPTYYSSLFATEDRHFWFASRNRVVALLATQVAAGLPPGYRVLEIGCGTGNVLRVLEKACLQGTVMGIDLFREGLAFASRRVSCPLVQADLRSLPFRMPLDILGLFDVLEHMDDDIGVLRMLRSVLAPGGAVLLTVPAHASLWSYFDEESQHRRRYAYQEFHEKLVAAGYYVEYMTYYMAPLLPLLWAGRRAATFLCHSPSSDMQRSQKLTQNELKVNPVISHLLTLCLTPELQLIRRRVRVPAGASLLALARLA